jgi:hypothetical protein
MLSGVIAFGGIHVVVGGGKSNSVRFRFLRRLRLLIRRAFRGHQLVPRHASDGSKEIK